MKREAGMTLIEVMVALVIFALAGLAVMQSTLQQTRQLGRMEEKILASWLADNQLVQLRQRGFHSLPADKPARPGGKKAIPRRWPPCAPG